MERLLKRELPFTHTGESWDISCRPATDEVSTALNGRFAGKKITDIIDSDREGILGRMLSGRNDFPLLVKIIDANDDLSVQVHPNDEEANKYENYVYGKNEMWYVMDAPPEGCLIIGLKDEVTKEVFTERMNSGSVEDCLNRLPIKRGDVINIPSGLIHAITKGIMLAEIQQNSDITYRVYDYGRLGLNGQPRELHVDKALNVADFQNKISKNTVTGLTIQKNKNIFKYYIANEYFAIIEYELENSLAECSDEDKFYIFTCVDGSCNISGGGENLLIKEGDSVFIPAFMGRYEITGTGKCRLLKSFVPDVDSDFIQPLLKAGYSMEDIKNNTAV